ncbi:hypothetical protein LSPH26S_04938 [Lysinibacillus sphaericus]
MRVSSSEVTPQNFGVFFLQERFDEIYNQCHATFQEMVSNEQFNEIAQSFNANVQNYELFNKSTIAHYHQYVWLDDRQEKAIQVTMDSSNIIHSLLIKPYVVFPESDKKYSQNTYIMPIKEEWFVFWGGVNEFVNYHYAYEAQRYAYDLVIMKNDSTFKDSPNVNEKLLCPRNSSTYDATIFPEITTLIHNSKFELIYLYEEQQILLKTMTNGITIDSSFMQEVHLIYQYKEMIECILTGIIATDKIKNYSLNLLSLKYSELIQSI